MKRSLLAALAALGLLAPAAAVRAADKPLVMETGQVKQLPTATALQLQAATTANASVILPHGAAPTGGALVDGAVWTTTAGVYVRVSGTTVGPLSAGGPPGGSSGQIQYNSSGAFAGFTMSGDATVNTATGALTLATLGSGATATKITYNTKGLVTAGVAAVLASADYVNQGATTTLLHGNASGNPSWASVSLAADVTGNLGVSHLDSGTNADTAHYWRGDGTWATLAAVGASNPFPIGTAQVAQVTGVPSSAYPAGSISMRTDIPRAYLSLGAGGAIPARVQDVASNSSYTVTLGSSPTLSNYLVAVCFSNSGIPTTAAGWTSIGTHTKVSNDPYANAVYHQIISSDTTSQTPCSTATSMGVAVKELSGVDATAWANSFVSIQWAQSSGTGSLSVTNSATTSTTNVLGVAASGFTRTSGIDSPPVYTGGTWANLTTQAVGQTNYTGIAEQSYASSGATVTSTITEGASVITQEGLVGVLILLKPSSNTGAVPLSKLTTIKNSGSAITSDALSINFSTGMSCSDDGLGQVTCISTGAGGTVTVTGSPASGNIAKFSGPTAITNGDISGDCTTSGALAILCTKTSGVAFTYFATGTDSANLTGNLAAARITTNLSAAIDSAFTCSARGSVLYRGASGWACLAPSTSGYSLTTQGAGADVAWTNVGGGGGGGVTQVNTEAGWTSGGPITSTGQVTVSGAVKAAVAAQLMSAFGGL